MIKVLSEKNSVKLWGVVYVSDIKARVVANFSQEFVCQKNSKVLSFQYKDHILNIFMILVNENTPGCLR